MRCSGHEYGLGLPDRRERGAIDRPARSAANQVRRVGGADRRLADARLSRPDGIGSRAGSGHLLDCALFLIAFRGRAKSAADAVLFAIKPRLGNAAVLAVDKEE